MSIAIKSRRDTAADWTSTNPVLSLGELGIETDTLLFKVGDGTTAWTSLSYMVSGGIIDPVLTTEVKTDTTTPTDLAITTGADKTLLLGTPVYMDENFDPIIGRGASAPGLTTLDTTSIQIVAFNGSATTEQVSSHRELNHNYEEGTDLSFHIHWAPTDTSTGDVKWQLEYYITDGNGATVRASGTISVVTPASGTAWDTTIASIGTVTGTTFEIADQISLRLFRDPSDAADTYASDAVVKTFGYHYKIDTMGSRGLVTK